MKYNKQTSIQHPFMHSGPRQTAYNWEDLKTRTKDFYDDGTLSFFWYLSCLINVSYLRGMLTLFCAYLYLLYVALLENANYSSEYNMKRGISAVIMVFLLFGVLHTPDGPFLRPHPAFWRFILCLSILYELILVFLLFQASCIRQNSLYFWFLPVSRRYRFTDNNELCRSVDDARQWLRYLDLELGKPLEEKDYGGNCRIYDWDRPDNPWHNVIVKPHTDVPSSMLYIRTGVVSSRLNFPATNLADRMGLPNRATWAEAHFSKIDGFVLVHFIGWWAKMLILRDYWICNVLSFAFEVLEYSLEHQLPNFSECWWDHHYYWRGMWNIPSYRGKLRRAMLQFTPHRWTDFDWRPTGSLKRWLGTLVLGVVILTAELNTFYLKFVLWVPPPHFLCLGRLIFLILMGATAIREYFEYLDDPKCKRFGRQAWMLSSIIITELLIVMKFGWDVVTKPFPKHICIFWSLILTGLILWTFWHFYVVPWLFRWSRVSNTVEPVDEAIQNHRLKKVENSVVSRRNAKSAVKLLNHS
ncbi:Phosphatidylserine synthase 2 [Schistosoma japonicum]|nr:Phosphatidylserine synthase 2 [Schistosoma japonicum]